jgi:beta-phosphoglucomutase-like phosphatase (HAD superfamily)
MDSIKATIEKSRYDAVIFDLDGVVTQTAAVHAAAWKRLFDAYLAERAARPRRYSSKSRFQAAACTAAVWVTTPSRSKMTAS